MICGDILPQRKPNPAPLYLAYEQLSADPKLTLYIGDAKRDIEAGNNAGMKTPLANWGYISVQDQPHLWQADATINSQLELLELIALPA